MSIKLPNIALTGAEAAAWAASQKKESGVETMNKERLEHGRAVAMGTLGGAKANCSLVALIVAVRDMTLAAAKGESFEWSDSALLAIADIDSELERAATDRTRLAEAIRRNSELSAANKAACERADKLQECNDNQAETIQAFESRHLENMKAAESLVATLNKAEKARDAIEAYAREVESDCELARKQRNIEIDRANTAERQLERLMKELGGWTLGQLPKGAYGGALVGVYCDIKAGR